MDSAGVAVERSDERSLSFDTFVFPPPPDLVEPELNAGGAPSSRSILRVELPASIIDSSNLVRVTLIVVPSVPALGAPGDTFTLQTEPLTADFGPKSPIVPTLVPGLGSAEIPVGSADTVRIDVTHIARLWRLNLSVPRSFMLRVTPEASDTAVRRALFVATLSLASVAVATPLWGQASLYGVLGVGLPGQAVSVRSRALGWGLAAFDAGSAVNPAAVGLLGRLSVAATATTSFRKFSAGETTAEGLRQTRFLYGMVGGRVARSPFSFAISFAPYLDRTSDIASTVSPTCAAP